MATIAPSDPRTPESADAPRGVRAFFALSPDAEVRESLAALGRDVARRCRGRAVSPENAHLTLAFIGDIDKSALPVLQRVGDGVPKSGFDVNFDSLGAWRASGVAWIAPSVLPPAVAEAARGACQGARGSRVHARDEAVPAPCHARAPLPAALAARPQRAHRLARGQAAPGRFGIAGGRASLPRPRVLGFGGALAPRHGSAPGTRLRVRPAAPDRRDHSLHEPG